MNIYLLISLCFFAVSAIFGIVKQLQMLQQNSYFPSRYFKWLKDNVPLIQVFFYFISAVLLYFKLIYVLIGFSAIVLAFNIFEAINTQKKSIKKLAFTGRVKRQFVAGFIVLLALISLYALDFSLVSSKISVILTLVISLITPLFTFIIWAITYPIEKAFSAWYIHDAKRILKKHSRLKVIGITGSYGKTTTKFILNRILSEKYNVVCTPQSFNTPMGVVRTIREALKPQTEIFICEMGAKKVKDIKEICDIVHPDFGIITSVGAQHLETFKSVDNVFKTKFELADAVTKKSGNIFVNLDSKEISNRIKNDDYFTYGTDAKAKFKVSNLRTGRNGSFFTLNLNNEKIKLTTKLLGVHNIVNIAGAAALSYSLGVKPEDIKYAVSCLKATEHRLEMKLSVNSSVMIDDAYNANPEGCLEAVRVLNSFDNMTKVIITPGLIELGVEEYNCNFALGLEAAKTCDIIIFVGPNRSKPMVDAVNTTDFNKDNMFIAKSFFEAMEIYSRFADKNTVVLVENDLPDNYLN